jgi:hypothetical protein
VRYKVTGAWSVVKRSEHGLAIEAADCTDTRDGRVYRDGAYRITRDGKPYQRGKGGTVPWFGELAWANAERALSDLWWAARNARSA